MTSVAIASHRFEQQSTEIFSTSPHYEDFEDSLNPFDDHEEMADADTQTFVENEYDDQDIYNVEIESTIVEPPQSDAVLTHAPSTIVDEMEYLEEVEYEETDPSLKIPDIHSLAHESETYKADTTVARTPPPTSLLDEQHLHPQMFSPASRILPHPRPATPLLSNIAGTTSTAEVEPVDDEWPICLYTPTGQEYMLFRSDGDAEALFEDNWLKFQPLETLFSSIRQTLENELASLTNSFSMDEIVLAIPDLDVSIAEDNCYTREITLQDLVNLIDALCAKNGTERANTCRLQLSLQPRFIARFNQLVASTSQSWESKSSVGNVEPSEEANDEDQDGNSEGNPEQDIREDSFEEFPELQLDFDDEDYVPIGGVYEEGDHTEVHDEEDFGNDAEANTVEVESGLTAAEEDELYEENDEADDAPLESAEDLVNSAIQVQDDYEDPGNHEDYNDLQDEEDYSRLEINPVEISEHDAPLNDLDTNHNDDDDLISYEEAVDQNEDGVDYRQEFITEQTLASEERVYKEDIENRHIVDDVHEAVPVDNHAGIPQEDLAAGTVGSSPQDAPALPGTPKRPLEIDSSIQDKAPPSKRAKS